MHTGNSACAGQQLIPGLLHW